MTKDPYRVIFISRVDFVPEILEMVRFSLGNRTGQEISLIYHPFNEKLKIEGNLKNSYLLVEKGFEKQLELKNYEPVDMALQLAWVVVTRQKLFNLLDRPNVNLENFGKALIKLKSESPYSYPWFEAIYSKDTLYNFYLTLSEKKTSSSAAKTPFWQQKNAAGVLCRAMEQGLLNPLSVEADQTLSTKVFLASDSVCFTSWIPIEFLTNSKIVAGFFPDSAVIPFPGRDGPAVVPVLSFSLWQRRSVEKIEFKNQPRKDIIGMTFSNQNLEPYLEWINKEFSIQYDRLIMGDI
jgi:hypothetical protein